MDGWIYLAPEEWKELVAIGHERSRKKNGYVSRRPGRPANADAVGIIGEAVFAKAVGLEVDKSDRPEGDDGYDFERNGKTLDVKATTYEDAHIIEHTYEQKAHYAQIKPLADYIALVFLDGHNRRGKIRGYCTREQLEAALGPGVGHGERLMIHQDNLTPGVPGVFLNAHNEMDDDHDPTV